MGSPSSGHTSLSRKLVAAAPGAYGASGGMLMLGPAAPLLSRVGVILLLVAALHLIHPSSGSLLLRSPPISSPTPTQATLLKEIASAWTISGEEASSVLNWTSSDACDGSYGGVDCHSGLVTALNLGWIHLAGTIPASLGKLSSLQRLYMGANQLSGSIPGSFRHLRNLQYLELYSNQLEGNIPTYLGTFAKLQVLNMGTNRLSGGIPTSFKNLHNVSILHLDTNQLSGSIPESLGDMTSLQDVRLDHNMLSGSIPASLGNLISLGSLDLESNQLSGRVPASFRNLTSLMNLYLNDNYITGGISLDGLSNYNDEYNCIGTAVSEQRSLQECSQFCKTTSRNGACRGHGICSFAEVSGLPSCNCYQGYTQAKNDPATCIVRRKA